MMHLNFSPVDGRPRNPGLRKGSVIIEVVLAAALLATAGVALAKLSRGASSLNRQADYHLAASLAADNALQRLSRVDVGQISERASAIEKTVAEISGCDVKIQVEDFQDEPFGGVHIRVDAMTPMSVNVRRHDWRIRRSEDDSKTAEQDRENEDETSEDSQ